MANKNLISYSSYNIYDKNIEIAKKYIFPDLEDPSQADLDFLRTGSLGYITEAMTMGLRDVIMYNATTKAESVLYTAKTSAGIYNWAKTYNVGIDFATPSRMNVSVSISAKSILDHAILGSNSYFNNHRKEWNIDDTRSYVVLDRTTAFYTETDGTPFSLPYSIIFEVNNNQITYRYAYSETPPFPYIKTVATSPKMYYTYDTQSGSQIINLNLDLFQYNTKSTYKSITSSKLTDNKILSFDFTDQLAGFKAFYIADNSVTEIATYFNALTDIMGEVACYYNLSDENSIQLIFSAKPDAFRPKINTNIKIESYVTTGSAGNFTYLGGLSYTFNTTYFKDINVDCISSTSDGAVGGKDGPTLDEIKSKIISQISTKNTIVTENDLNEYFSTLSNSAGYLEFVKRRDDLIRRIFTAYCVLYYTDDYNVKQVLPTNTVDISVTDTNNTFIIEPYSTAFSMSNDVSNSTRQVMKVVKATTDPPKALYNYVCPFYVRFNVENKTPYVTYILPYVNSSSGVHTTKTDARFLNNIIPTNVDVKRDIGSNNIAVKLSTVYYKSSLDTNLIVCECTITDKYNHSITKSNVEFNTSNVSLNGVGTVDTTFNFNIPTSEGFGVVDNRNVIKISNSPTGTYQELNSEANVSFKFFLATKTGDDITKTEDLLFEAKSDNSCYLFKNMDDIMYSNVSVIVDDTVAEKPIKEFILRNVPMIKYFSNFSNITSIATDIDRYITMLKENASKLETSTNFDFKLFNTYGLSTLSGVDDTGVSNVTNLNADINIKLKMGVNLDDTARNDVEKDIRKFVAEYVESANADGRYSGSELISATSLKFIDIIEHISIYYPNTGLTNPYIIINKKNPKYPNLIPEYINVTVNNVTFETARRI